MEEGESVRTMVSILLASTHLHCTQYVTPRLYQHMSLQGKVDMQNTCRLQHVHHEESSELPQTWFILLVHMEKNKF